MEYEFKSKAPVVFSYGKCKTPFGQALVILMDGQFVHLSFLDSEALEKGRLAYAAACIKTYYPFARLVLEDISSIVNQAFSDYVKGNQTGNILYLGTPFHERIWQTVARIPFGKILFYEDIASETGCRNSVRSCSQIISANPVACLVPCHRVVPRLGNISYYRWGQGRQKALLEFEEKFLMEERRKKLLEQKTGELTPG